MTDYIKQGAEKIASAAVDKSLNYSEDLTAEEMGAIIASVPMPEPVTWLRFRAAQRITQDVNVDSHEWLEECRPGDIGDDRMPAFPVYTAPVGVSVPDGFVLMPMLPNKAMIAVMESDEWHWEDLLAAAEVVTEDQYNAVATALSEPPAVNQSVTGQAKLCDECGAVHAPGANTLCPTSTAQAFGDGQGAELPPLREWPEVEERRPLSDADPDGYREGDRDFIANNLDAAVWLLENANSIRAELTAQRPAKLSRPSDDDLVKLVFDCNASDFESRILTYPTGPYEISRPTSLLRTLAQAIVDCATQPAQCAEQAIKCSTCGEVNPAEIHTCSPQVGRDAVCTWRVSDDEYAIWSAACSPDVAYNFIEGGPVENGHKFCHACGKPLVVDATMAQAKGGA